MNKWIVLILGFTVVVLVFIVIKIKPFYSPAVKQNGLLVTKHFDDTIRIAYIGDSWADKHRSVDCVIDSIVRMEVGKPVLVKTAGVSGLTSKNIYYGIFRNNLFREAIEWGPDFCFVVAGINDSDRKMGKGYYKENMRLIIDLLLENGITPIILEIPSYDINFSFKRRNRVVKIQYLVSMLLTWSKMDCIEDYRKEYIELVEEQKWADKVISVASEEWNPDGYKDNRVLYDGGRMHLNDKGYHVLDSCIAHKIIHYINTIH